MKKVTPNKKSKGTAITNQLKISKQKNNKIKKKLGMGLSSLLSKDQELASVIKTKVQKEAQNSSLKIQMPKLSNNDGSKLSLLSLKKGELSSQGEVSNQKMVPIQYLVSSKFQPRKTFNQTELEELSESIKSNGVLQPILVRPINRQNTSFEIIAGERRWRASQLAKLHEVPVIVRNFSDETAMGVAMIENLQRSDLNLIEEAEGYRTMMNVFEYTQEKLSSHLGKSRSHIANVLRILSLPKTIRQNIINGQLSFGHARALVTLPEDKASDIVEVVLNKELSVRQTEKMVNSIKRSLTNSTGNQYEAKQSGINPNIESLEKELTNLLGLKIVINHKTNNSGNLSIFYKSLDQIQPVIDKLKWRPK